MLQYEQFTVRAKSNALMNCVVEDRKSGVESVLKRKGRFESVNVDCRIVIIEKYYLFVVGSLGRCRTKSS